MLDPMTVAGLGAAGVSRGLQPPQVDATQLRVGKPLAEADSGVSFKDMLTEAMGEVERLQTEANTTIRQLVAGEITDVTETMVAVEKADVAFQTMMLVRNKMVQAYEEIMRMQV